MFVSHWMTKKVFTLSPEDSIIAASQLSKERGIKHIPIVKGEKIKGILSVRDVQGYIASRNKALDVHELHELLTKAKVKDIMKTKVITVTPEMPVEEAALILHDNNIGCLPVIEGNKLAGIISDRDIFRVLVDITGVRHRGHRVSLPLKDEPGSLQAVSAIISKHGFRLQSILTSYEEVKKGHRHLVIRLKGSGNFTALKSELEGTYLGVKIIKG